MGDCMHARDIHPTTKRHLIESLIDAARNTSLTGEEPSASFRSLKTALFSPWVSRTRSASDWCALQETLYKCIDTIQYKETVYLVVLTYRPKVVFSCYL